MKFFDLFCGVGGFRLGMEANGNVCIGSCEIDKYARQTYAKNFGHEPEYTDVRKINPRELEDFDCLCAGFPCQAFSIAGKRRGFDDTRGTLFFEIMRIAREKQPSILFLENVKGLLSHDKGETFRTIIESMDELGYDVEWQVLDSANWVPQHRERIFLIGHLRGKPRSQVFSPHDTFKDQDDRNTNSKKEGISATLTTKQDRYPNAGFVVFGSTQPHSSVKTDISPTLTEAMGKGGGHRPFIVDSPIVYSRLFKNKMESISPTLTSASGSGSKPIVEVVSTLNKDTYRGNGRRMKSDNEDSFTITTLDRHGIRLDGKYRFFTPLECERLQGFPDGWTEGVSDVQRYKQMGNAVTATVVEYIAQLLTPKPTNDFIRDNLYLDV